MRLEDIGFYTLSDKRAIESSECSPLYRCELILTDRCNFRCTYCRGLPFNIQGVLPIDQARTIIDLWMAWGLKNVRFSGGEPGLYPHLKELICQCREGGIERIAISTNGSLTFSFYEELIALGVNDFSISLDSGCCSISDKITGSTTWDRVTDNIRKISDLTYTSVGMVFIEETVGRCVDDVLFVDSLGVSDIRVIPAAQYANALSNLRYLPMSVLSTYPILSYRVRNQVLGHPMRGLGMADRFKCWLALDDMAVAGKYHYPCIIYMREGGSPIGEISSKLRQERKDWVLSHSSQNDNICNRMCLDVCRDYNNKANTAKESEYEHVVELHGTC